MFRLIKLLVLCLGLSVAASAQEQKLFRLMTPSETGVNFSNPIEDTREANILIYESFYNGGGVALGDLNNDGLDDIYFAGNQVADQLYLNTGKLTFQDITSTSGILNKGGWSTGVSMVDINQDGRLDIYVCKSLYDESPELRTNELYINEGPNEAGIPQFSEQSRAFGLNDLWRSMQATFLDYDKDGDPDMFLVNQPPNPGMFSPLAGHNWLDTLFSCRLLENREGKFIDVSLKAGIKERGYGLSAVSADFNNDGWTDLYVCNDYDSPDFLYLNNKDGSFKNAINTSMKHISYFSMGSDAADINNDGLMDLITLDMVAEDNYRLKANMGGMEPEKFWNIVNAGGHRQYMFNTLQLNQGTDEQGHLLFSDIAQYAGVANTDWSWAPLCADFDNDGYQDLFISNGIKRDLKNTDALKKVENYLKLTTDAFIKENPNAGEVGIWDIIDLADILAMLPSEKLSNYVYKNTGNYRFEKKMKDWGLDQKTLSSGAAYSDLDGDGDLDLVLNNVDDVAFIYQNQSNTQSKNNYLRIQLTDTEQNRSVIGAKIAISYKGGKQYREVGQAKGFYSDSEDLIHFGLGKHKKVDEIVVTWATGEQSKLSQVKANQRLVIDQKTATAAPSAQPNIGLFSDITDKLNLTYRHVENGYDDFEKEILLPHQMSTLGPGIAVADVNLDGLEDFFVGGASMQAGQLFLQEKEGNFTPLTDQPWEQDKNQEDLDAVFLDVDLDGDQDLYVVSGGNEAPAGSAYYQDRLYLNMGKGTFVKSENLLPEITASGSRVIPGDFDKDGDLDLFVGGRQVPGQYPRPADSYLLKNMLKESGKAGFSETTASDAPEFRDLGMVTDAVWTDIDQDNDQDLIVVGEWMPITVFINEQNKLTRLTDLQMKQGANSHLSGFSEVFKQEELSGWWNSINAADLDGDGDMDYVLGNLGQNYKYKATKNEPFSVHYDDFDDNGSYDIVLSYYNFGEQFPLRGRSCSSQQIPKLTETFKDYHSFASSTLTEIYGENSLQEALTYEASTFASICLEQVGKGQFRVHPLPPEAQFSSINTSLVKDLNEDGILDLILSGNLYHAEVETPRNDAGLGLVLMGKGNFNYEAVPHELSKFSLPYEVKEMQFIQIGGRQAILAGINDDRLRVIVENN